MRNINKKIYFILSAFIVAVIVILLLSYIEINSGNRIQDIKDPYTLLEQDKWGWDIPNAYLSCGKNPHSIKFADNFNKMFLKFDKVINSADGGKTDTAVYNVIKSTINRVREQLFLI